MREGGYYHYAIICYNSGHRRTTEHACVAVRTSVCKTILIKHSISEFLFLALRYVKEFPAGAVRPAHRMPNAFLVVS